MARLVFATRRPPWPLDNGARIRALRLAQGLAERFDLTLLTFADGPAYDATTAGRADLERALPGAGVVLVPYERRPPGGVRRNTLQRRSAGFGHYATPGLRQELARLAGGRPDTILHLDDPGVALAGVGLSAGLTAVAAHNVEHRIIRAVARRSPLAHRPFALLEAAKVAREERRIWTAADVCVAVSEIDAASMRARGAGDVLVCPNGSDEHDRVPLPALRPNDELRLLFVGSMRFEPYAYGLSWFIDSALPAIRRAAGPVRLDVVGEHGGGIRRADDVVYHGSVPDVRAYYQDAHALVLPVFEGSGTRLKVIEAALLGRPVVSTGLGVEGLPLPPDGYLQADDAVRFASALQRLRGGLETTDPAIAAMCAVARASLAGLTWRRIAARLADEYVARHEAQTTRVL